MGEYHTKRVLALVYQGENAISKVRKVIGDTNPEKAEPTTIRGKYGRITSKGVFENVYTYTLSSKSGEDLTEGMPVVFAGLMMKGRPSFARSVSVNPISCFWLYGEMMIV